MSLQEQKQHLIGQINHVNDGVLIQAMEQLISAWLRLQPNVLSSDQIEQMLEEGSDDFKKGHTISIQELQKEVSSWRKGL